MSDKTCDKCGKVFQHPNVLRRHLQRKTSCAPIQEGSGEHSCKYCGRNFASYHTLYQHLRKSCKIARSDEGMELLFEHTLKRQQETEIASMRHRIDEQEGEMAEMRAMMEQLQVAGPAAMNNKLGDGATMNLGQINNNTINVFADHPMALSPEVLLDAIRTCPSFHRFSQIHDDEKFSDENRHIIHGSIMDLTARSHEAPENRNIYLSRQRTDQVMVMASSEAADPRSPNWAVLPLGDAIKTMVAGMSDELRKVGGDHTIKMEIDDRGALCGLGFATLAEGAALASEMRPQMVAHLIKQRAKLSVAPPSATAFPEK